MELFDTRESAAIEAAIPAMTKYADDLNAEHVAPTRNQQKRATAIVWEVISRRERVIYGGHSLNMALVDLGRPAIYVEAESPDVEFYSPDPLADIREICDRLFAAGHDHVQGREAAHLGTFTVSVEFKRICDVTWVPKAVLRAIPTRSHLLDDGASKVAYVCQRFALIDHLRMLCDPFTSHWRLDKTIPRLLLIQKHWPVSSDPPESDPPAVRSAKPTAFAAQVFEWLGQHSGSLVAVGDLASEFFKTGDEPCRMPAHVQVVSVDYENDLSAFALSFPDATMTERYPVLDLFGRSACFLSGACTFTLIDYNGRPVPTIGVAALDEGMGIRVASFSYTLMMILASSFAASARGHTSAVGCIEAVKARLLRTKADAMRAAEGALAFDTTSMFREINVVFVGKPETDMSRHMLDHASWLVYNPANPKRGIDAMRRFMLPKVDGSKVRSKADSAIRFKLYSGGK